MYFSPPVSTAWTCQLTTPSRTWERNSSWLWRTRRASRGSTKKNSSPWLHPTNRQLKKKYTKEKKPQGCQTSCCSSSVRACCTVQPACEPPPQHGGLRLYSDLSSQYAYVFVSFQRGRSLLKRCWGKNGRVATSNAEIYYPQAWAGPLWSAVSFPSTLVLWKSTVLENTNAFQ